MIFLIVEVKILFFINIYLLKTLPLFDFLNNNLVFYNHFTTSRFDVATLRLLLDTCH